MTQSLIELHTIATRIREQFETHKVDYRKLKELYSQYALINNLETFIKQSKLLFPHLNRGLATLYIQDELHFGEVIQGKFDRHNHTFLLLRRFKKDKDIIIDITADQYKGPKIYVGELIQPWRLKDNPLLLLN